MDYLRQEHPVDVLHGLLLEAHQGGQEAVSFGDIGDVRLANQRAVSSCCQQLLCLVTERQDGSELEPALQEGLWRLAQVSVEIAADLCPAAP